MAEHIVKILESNYITHDVKQFRLQKPQGYIFIPGQATDVSINLPEWKDQLRPFTFTSLPEWDFLEFTIKIYTEREGVTNMLGKMNKDAELILHDVFGAIQFKGNGVFIAGGAGITPFISILRSLNVTNQVHGNKLIFSNKTSEDVILEEELRKMLKKNFIKVFTRENVIGFMDKRINKDFLIETVKDFGQHFYVCGPDDFVKSISGFLKELGADSQNVVIEA